MDWGNRDMRAIGTTKDEVHGRTGWRRIVSVETTQKNKCERLEEEVDFEHVMLHNACHRVAWGNLITNKTYEIAGLKSVSNHPGPFLAHGSHVVNGSLVLVRPKLA